MEVSRAFQQRVVPCLTYGRPAGQGNTRCHTHRRGQQMAQGTVSPIVPTPAFSRERKRCAQWRRSSKCGVPKGFWIEADPRHVREVIKALGLEGAQSSPYAGRSGQERPGSKTTKAASTLSWGRRRPPCSVRSRRGSTSCRKTGPTKRSPP